MQCLVALRTSGSAWIKSVERAGFRALKTFFDRLSGKSNKAVFFAVRFLDFGGIKTLI